VVGDALIRPSEILAELEDEAVPGREPSEGTNDERVVEGVQRLLFSPVVPRRQVLVEELIDRLATLAFADEVGAKVTGNHAQPGIEASFSTEGRERPPSPHEGFLHDVFGFVLVVKALDAEAPKSSVVTGVEVVEGPAVTRLCRGHEGSVARDVDVVVQWLGVCGPTVYAKHRHRSRSPRHARTRPGRGRCLRNER
jgi:hypothetical protein